MPNFPDLSLTIHIPEDNEIPKGKGLYIWQVKRLLETYGSLDKLVDKAVYLGLDWVAIKVAGGGWRYNISVDLKALFEKLKSKGIKPWGWHYIYPNYISAQISVAKKQISALQPWGYILNAEKEFKGKPVQAEILASKMREAFPKLGLGLTSYRYPKYHPSFPFKQFLQYMDFNQPQVYWLGAHNPAWQLEETIKQNNAIQQLPIVPIGLAYSEGGYPAPTELEMDAFHQTTLDLNLPGNTWWSWHSASKNHLLENIRRYQFDLKNPPEAEPTHEEKTNILWNEAKNRGWFE